MNKLYTTVRGRRVFANNGRDRIIHDFADLAGLIARQDLPPRLLKDLGIRKVTPPK